jgi:S-adenosylmethionine:tRNA ribosyltransferase-isomerase
VGTTSARALESAALAAEAQGDRTGSILAGESATRLMIAPGHEWKAADALVTNFHLPRSTLLMLVSALRSREEILSAYREAVAKGYRFYSYGDAMWIERRKSG